MADDTKENREYKGPGKFTAAVGRGAVDAAVIGAVGGVVGTIGKSETRIERVIIGTLIGMAVGAIHGLYRGAKNASIAKEQLDGLRERLDTLETKQSAAPAR